MAEPFLSLDTRERADILLTVAARSRRTAIILEKDIWVCWVLQALFSMPDPHPMAFKGSTSLSKVYRIIDRFSEDVDVTLDYRVLIGAPFPTPIGTLTCWIRAIMRGQHSTPVNRSAQATHLYLFAGSQMSRLRPRRSR